MFIAPAIIMGAVTPELRSPAITEYVSICRHMAAHALEQCPSQTNPSVPSSPSARARRCPHSELGTHDEGGRLPCEFFQDLEAQFPWQAFTRTRYQVLHLM